jgi:protein TonB
MRGAISGAGSASPFARDRELRMLEYATAASIALHVLAFAALQQLTPRPEPTAAAPGPISARLVERAAPAPPVAPAPARAARPLSEPVMAAPAQAAVPKRQPAPAAGLQTTLAPESEPARKAEPARRANLEPKPAPRAEEKPRPPASPRPGAKAKAKARADPGARSKPAPQPVPDRMTASVAPSEPPAATPRSGTGAAPPSAADTARVDEDLVARYRSQLIGAARRYKRYPRAAMDNQWEGAAEVAMVIGADGRIVETTISRSSGHEVLDRQAIDMFRKAKPLVPIPAALRGRSFRITLKAIYSLRDPGA